MTLAATLRFVGTHLCPDCGIVNVPNSRDLCYGCSKPQKPRAVPESRLEHVRNHLRPQDRAYLDLLLEAMTLDEIARRLGPGWTRSRVEYVWHNVRDSMGLEGKSRQSLSRLALLRVTIGRDPCFCGK